MNINTLVDKIVHDMVAGTSCKVNVVNRSFFSQLIDDNIPGDGTCEEPLLKKTIGQEEKEEPSKQGCFKSSWSKIKKTLKWIFIDERPKLKNFYSQTAGKNKYRLPFTTYLLQMLWWVVRVILWLFYRLADGVWWLVTGKRRKVGLEYSVRFNAFLFFSVVIMLIVAFVACVSFFIRSVLFLSPENNINSEGAMSMKQPCGKEQYLYVYNTAQSWSNTGIEILEGDEVDISTSGFYYSSIADLYESSCVNEKPRYMPTADLKEKDPKTKNREDSLVSKLSVYRKTRSSDTLDIPKFGYLLFTVKSDEDWDYDDDSLQTKIYQGHRETNSNFARRFIAKDNGRLFVSINDIYLSEKVLNTLINERELFDMVIHTRDTLDSISMVHWKQEKLKNPTDTSKAFRELLRLIPDSAHQFKGLSQDTLDIITAFVRQQLYIRDSTDLTLMAKRRPEAWFDDNIGEILVNVTITRKHHSEGDFLSSFYATIYRNVKWCDIFVIAILLIIFVVSDGLTWWLIPKIKKLKEIIRKKRIKRKENKKKD